MTFIIVLLSVLLERFFMAIERLRPWGWLPVYASWLDSGFGKYAAWKTYARLAAIIIPVLVIVGIIQGVLIDFAPSWLLFIIDWVVLVYCLGPHNSYGLLKANDATHELADVEVEAITPLTWLVRVNETLFSVLFWFVILGPVGAVLYRLSAENQQGDEAAKQLTRLLSWIPARLLAFSYALVGHFVAVLPVWLAYVWKPLDQNDRVLHACGAKALGSDAEASDVENAAQSLVDRALIVWLVVLALLILL